jgi:hypothetical protein
MIVVLLLRRENPHIVNYYNGNDMYLTICGLNLKKKEIIETIAADDTFPGICTTCKHYMDLGYKADLNRFPREARGHAVFTEDMLKFHKLNILGPKSQYSDLLEFRITRKFSKYRRLTMKSGTKRNAKLIYH